MRAVGASILLLTDVSCGLLSGLSMIGPLDFFDMETELSQLFGRRVDLNTPHFLSPRIRARVQAEAEVLVGGS